MDPFFTGVLAGYGIAIPVGAIALLIIETGIRRGFPAAFAAGAGAATADLVYAGAAVVSGTAIVSLVSTVEEPLRLASGVLLTGIAAFGLWRTRRGEGRSVEVTVPKGRDLASTYARFLGLTLVNPTTVVYFVAVVVGLGIASGMSALEGFRFVAGAAVASLSWQTLIAWLGASVGGRLSDRARTTVSVVGYLVILGFAVVILIG